MNTQQSRNGNLWITVLFVFVLLLIAYFWWSGGLGTWVGGPSRTAIEGTVEGSSDTDDASAPPPADQTSGEPTPPATSTAEPPASGN